MAAEKESQKDCHCRGSPENEGKVNFGRRLVTNCWVPCGFSLTCVRVLGGIVDTNGA